MSNNNNYNDVQNNYSLSSDDNGEFVHHVFDDPPSVQPDNIVYMYFNFLSGILYNADYPLLMNLALLLLQPALGAAAMITTNTLGGLVAGMSSPAPSLIAIMACMSMINIESGSAMYKDGYKTFFKKTIPDEHTQDYHFRKIDVTNLNDFNRNYTGKKFLNNSVARFLGMFYIFDKLKTKLPADDVESPLYLYQINVAYNIAATIFHEAQPNEMSYSSSLASAVCPLYLQIGGMGNCSKKRASQYTKINYYCTPVTNIVNEAHNVLFTNSLPYFGSGDTVYNNYVSLAYKYLFYSQYGNLSASALLNDSLRKSNPKDVAFDFYIFDVTDDGGETPLPSSLAHLSWDAVPFIVQQLVFRDTNNDYNQQAVAVYDKIIKTAEMAFNFYSNYMEDMIANSNCALNGYYPVGESSKEYLTKLDSLEPSITVSDYAKQSNRSLIQLNERSDSNGHNLMQPFMNSYVAMGNMYSGFITTYHTTAGQVWIRQWHTYSLFSEKIDELITELTTTYDWDIGMREEFQPALDLDALKLVAENGDGDVSCLEGVSENGLPYNYLQIPTILGKILPEYSMRGYYKELSNSGNK